MNEIIDTTIYLGSDENPIIARIGITKKAESYALELINKEQKPISTVRWSELILEASNKFPVK